ncbi:5172_t:CDS:2 [Entrophospora sp. SA101]|nr:5163_t:CDS:2 [Entrophospora sp. SA101]CAJ0639331.1 5172_t:CDS:2 [Entrophospora sp. SA101]
MFGWSNSSIKNVSKCASYWRNYKDEKGEKKFHILYYVAPVFPYFYYPLSAENLTESFIPFLQEFGVLSSSLASNEKKPLVIAHAFSNGGTMGMVALINACKKHNFNLSYDAVILDSGPGTTGVFGLYKVYTVAETNLLKKILIFIIVEILLFFAEGGRNKDTIARIGTACPRLFIYSKADKLIPYKKIEDIIEKSKRSGFKTTTLRFEDSEHVRHWLTHKQEYEKTLDNFLINNNLLLEK